MSVSITLADRAAFKAGARFALGVPSAVVGAGYMGLGALVSSYGESVWVLVLSTIGIWALPGQLVLLDMWEIGAPMIAVVLAVTLTNARFLPMSLTLIPVLHAEIHPRARYYAAAQFVAMTSWAVCMRRCPELPAPERLPYFVGFSAACMTVGVLSGVFGYVIAGSIPPGVQLGLVFLTAVYFFVILIGEVQTRLAAISLACGGVAGPLFYVLTPQWSVLAAGFTGGTIAFAIQKMLGARRV